MTIMQNVQKRKLLRSVLAAVIAALLIAVPFVSVFFGGVFIPSQYSQTYYGELYNMYVRLKETEGRKIVIIGNSNVAFGVDSLLFEQLINTSDEQYTVCNFGLYGSLGTRMMLDLSRNFIGEGDIVIFVPEISEQSLSQYFSAQEAWYALDGGMEMFFSLPSDLRGSLSGAFFGYTAEKYALYKQGKEAQPSGIYAKSSFDNRCDLKNYSREYNVMPGGVDSNNIVTLKTSLYAQDFIDYVNEYCACVQKKGAAMYYSFPPMSNNSVADMSEQTLEKFTDFVVRNFDFPVISDISDYLMDGEWFYDSVFHLNSSGMTVRTVQLVNDLKNQLGITTKTEVVLPEKPVIPQPGIEGEGDNSCADCFTYSKDGNYYVIEGLTEKGAQSTDIIVPYQVDGLYVKGFGADVFAGNTTIEKITLQTNISSVADGSFNGCESLEKLILLHTDPAEISVGYNLTEGASFKIFVSESALSAFKNNYFWGHYADVLCAM